MSFLPDKCRPLCLFPLLILLSACCANKKLAVGATALLLEDVAKSSYRQSDLRVVREGMPAYLMLLDGMNQAWPDNERLLLAAAQGYSSFASAFIEENDKVYASGLYAKARQYAIKLLVLRGVNRPVDGPFDDFQRSLNKLDETDVPYLFWSATCWASWISLNLNSVKARAEIPRVEMMMKVVLDLDETYYYGGPHLFMGIWYASRPKIAGGNLEIARDHFLRAIELGEGKFLLAKIYYARHYAMKKFDRELFTAILNDVLNTPIDIDPDLTLLNSLAHRKAKEMLANTQEYF